MSSRIQWNHRAFEQIRRSPETQGEITRLSSGLAKRAGHGYEAKTAQGKTRFRAIVVPTTWKARADNARKNTLVNELHKGGT